MAAENSVRALEGTSALDYPDAFFSDIALIANSDPQGTPNVIDRGDEAIALAHLFITSYPTALPRTITSADVSDYLTGLWSPSRQLVEAQVESLLHQIERDPSTDEVTYKGKTYSLGNSPIMEAINEDLASSGSYYRVFMTTDRSLGPLVLYGPLVSEEIKEQNGHKVRLIALRSATIRIGAKMLVPAVNDNHSTIMTIEDDMRELLLNLSREGRLHLNDHYRAVHERVCVDFSKEIERPGELPRVVTAMRKAALVHEWAHFDTAEESGAAYQDLKGTRLFDEGEALYELDEVYADLPAVQQMVDLAATDETSAIRIFQIWNILRSGAGASGQCISNLLLSAARIQDGMVVVDWKMLQKNLSSFREELRGIFADLMSRIYEARAGQPRIAGEVKAIKEYRQRVNAWMADHLGLDPAAAPFN